MNMNNSMVRIVDLPDEMLLTILNKLNNIDILYSLVGVNRKLNNVACDTNFTRTIDLITISSNEDADSEMNVIFDRFCMQILPRIDDNIECLIVEAYCFQLVLNAINYYKLRKLTLVNLELNMGCHIFNGMLQNL